MNSLPASAECRCVLPDGRVLTVTATRRPRAGRAELKCVAQALSARMREVVLLARHTETRFDSRDQVVLSIDIAPLAWQRGWELAAVLADRMVRGQYRAAQAPLFADGWSDAWHLGQVTGRVGGQALTHLGGLSGHTDPAASVSSARAWFPLHSGGLHDALAWVEVSVRPLGHEGSAHEGEQGGGHTEEDSIAVPGQDLLAQLAVRQALAGSRHFDGRGLGRWRTVVRFSQANFHGNSYELALVMADRLARGREFVPRGRLIASGCSSAWHAGRVESVDSRDAKLALILGQLGPGDRVLLPGDWQDDSSAVAAREQGASLAWIECIGII